ncbi:MAG: hypothetical protein JW744_04795 [Candidatus Diapherotrites archaeon]|uniref:Uncharacterized protein n=1 Tax=Candidatus Iainarchaeum sp. TaxID=3101447 RepID=A0A939CAG8_9ARCH|nr:hypothetical protein [Candidatus Diapherotrites archaeon]
MDRDFAIRVFIVLLALWLALGVIYMLIPNQFEAVCKEKCSAHSFDVVLAATSEECRCYNTINRVEKIIENI